MPIYEYRCLECGKISEVFLRSFDSQDARCPACGSGNVDKLVSAAHGSRIRSSRPGTTCCGRAERCELPPLLG